MRRPGGEGLWSQQSIDQLPELVWSTVFCCVQVSSGAASKKSSGLAHVTVAVRGQLPCSCGGVKYLDAP